MLDRLSHYSPCLDAPQKWAIATVIEVSGSVPRPIGTSMAVRSDSLTIGSISGGCVESAIVVEALDCIAESRSTVADFGYSDGDGISIGLMCGGDLRVLIQPVAGIASQLRVLLDAHTAGSETGTLVRPVPLEPAGLTNGEVRCELPKSAKGTVTGLAVESISPTGSISPAEVAADPASSAEVAAGFSPVAGISAESSARPRHSAAAVDPLAEALVVGADGVLPAEYADQLGQARHALTELVRMGGCGLVEVRDETRADCPVIGRLFVESRRPRARILIYGANDFSSAICQAAALLDRRVTVCDARPIFATAARHPGADEVVVAPPGRHFAQECEAGRVDERTAVIMLTHDPRFDLPVLDRALRMGLAYVGALGSRSTHEKRAQELLHGGLPADRLAMLHSPIGLDIGARTPAEVAVSVMAEFIAVTRGRGGPKSSGAGVVRLRDTTGAVHDTRTDEPQQTAELERIAQPKEGTPSWT